MAFTGICTTFRTLGAAAFIHNLFSIENQAGSAVTVTLRKLVVIVDATATLTVVMPLVKCTKIFGGGILPAGGTTLTKGSFDSTQSSAAQVVCRGATASDGGGATAIVCKPGIILWQQYAMRMHTIVGQVLYPDNSMIPLLNEEQSLPSLILRAGEALLIQVNAAPTSSNPNTNHWVVNCMWQEA